MRNSFYRKGGNKRKTKAGIALKCRAGPPKNLYTVSKQDKVVQLKSIFARKDTKIPSLEMENGLGWDFLPLTRRKREHVQSIW